MFSCLPAAGAPGNQDAIEELIARYQLADVNWTGIDRCGLVEQPAADGEHKIAFNDMPPYEDASLGPNADIFLVNPDGSGLDNMRRSPDLYEASPTWALSATRMAIWD